MLPLTRRIGNVHTQLSWRRGIFKNLKNKNLPQISTKVADIAEARDHEYSIRPDTFAFKVSARYEKERSIAPSSDISATASMKPHPFQKDGTGQQTQLLNPIQFIYQNATNYPFKTRSPQEVFSQVPSTNFAKLARQKQRPIRVKMLVSDFIENSLYNSSYGYFSREVEIFHTEKPFNYNEIRDVDEFMEYWRQAYSKYDKSHLVKETSLQAMDETVGKLSQNHPKTSSKLASAALEVHRQDMSVVDAVLNNRNKRSLQLWHTPTELFLPFYGEAIARYILHAHTSNEDHQDDDLVIFEMGGGNGTLMCNILNYIKQNRPDIYSKTKYNIIEISNQLAQKQFEKALSEKLILQGLHFAKVEIINESIFDTKKTIVEKCYFIALEVFDNFSHDLIRYDNVTGEPYEGQVLIDEKGDFYEFFTPELSYYSNAYLELRENGDNLVLNQASTLNGRFSSLRSMIPLLDSDDIHPLHRSSALLRWKNSLMPFKDNMTPGEFIPTRLLQFFHILKHRFPNHALISSDFHQLPKQIKGYHNGPVVQTVLQNRMIDASTYMCYPGYFDIMFATDFRVMSEMYHCVTGKAPRVETHRQFLEQWADTEVTKTKTAENPMLDFYRNVSFMVS